MFRVVQCVLLLLGVPCDAVRTLAVECFRVFHTSFYGYCFHVAVEDATDGKFVCRASPLSANDAETLNDEINVVVVSELAFLLLLLRPGPEVTQCG